MIGSKNVPDVQATEKLARYILHRRHIRASNQTLKPDAFVPHPHSDLSVTRHLSASEDEIWSVGEDVATTTGKVLYGRGDIQAMSCLRQKLMVHAAPVEGNPNHADIRNWPADKAAQKIIALEIAATAVFVARSSV